MNRVKICDVAPIKQSSENLDSEKVWLLNLDMIESDSGKVIDFQYFDKDELGNSISKFDNENVLYSKLRPYLNKVVVPEQPGFCTSELVTFRPLKNILDRYYFSAFLRSRFFVEYINSKSSGAKMPRANMDALKNAYIPLPPLPEQQKIAHHLDTIQSAIDNKKQQLVQLDELVKSKFVEMFGDTNLNDKNFDTEIGKNLFKFSSGKFLSAELRLESGIPVYGGNGIAWYTEKPLIEYSTIIIGRVGAYCGNVKLVTEPVWITDNALFIKEFKTLEFNLQFLLQLMENINFAKYAGKVAQPKITQGPLEEQVYIIPPIELQNTFAQYVQKIDAAKSIIKTQLVDLQELLDSKMDEYFGE